MWTFYKIVHVLLYVTVVLSTTTGHSKKKSTLIELRIDSIDRSHQAIELTSDGQRSMLF